MINKTDNSKLIFNFFYQRQDHKVLTCVLLPPDLKTLDLVP